MIKVYILNMDEYEAIKRWLTIIETTPKDDTDSNRAIRSALKAILSYEHETVYQVRLTKSDIVNLIKDYPDYGTGDIDARLLLEYVSWHMVDENARNTFNTVIFDALEEYISDRKGEYK